MCNPNQNKTNLLTKHLDLHSNQCLGVRNAAHDFTSKRDIQCFGNLNVRLRKQ